MGMCQSPLVKGGKGHEMAGGFCNFKNASLNAATLPGNSPALDRRRRTQYNTEKKRNEVVRHMIVLDLEWNRGYDKKPLNEILQIGAVRIERLGGPVLDTFNAYIKPAVHKKFDLGAKVLPELQASLSSNLSFAAAMEQLRAWCGGETIFACWGWGDLDILAENCKYWGLSPLEAEKTYDFQRAFSDRLQTSQQLSLWRAVEYCRIPDVFTFHNALNDALYTSILGQWLTLEALENESARRGGRRAILRLSKLPFSPQPRQKIGPFPTPGEVLNAKLSRKPPCPLCGQKGCVIRWHFARPRNGELPRQYYAVFSCPEHGRFLCRLTLANLEDGQWRGRRCVPVLTPEVMRDYAAALEEGVYLCKGAGKRHRRSRSGQQSGQAPA